MSLVAEPGKVGAAFRRIAPAAAGKVDQGCGPPVRLHVRIT